ncbi:MAG: ABC transporter ATP-binding protein [Bacillota bacterium]
MANVVEMRGVTKRFPGVLANDRVDFAVSEGEIHALLGENGAGKSTLMNVLYGLYQPDEGQIYWKGQPISIADPNKAISLGIGMVHQHFMLVQPFTVTENIVLGAEPSKAGRLDMKTAREKVRGISQRYGLDVDPDARIQDISVGQQQRVEILKALYRGAELLILDEPTAVLTPQEIEELLTIMRNLTAQGKSIIFITHKLREVMAACDRVTVIRRGRVMDTLQTKTSNVRELAKLMVGRDVVLSIQKAPALPQEPILKVEGLQAKNHRGLPALRGVDLEVRAGEIVGLAGVEGNGQSELVEVLTGLRKATAGRVLVEGQEITNLSPRRVGDRGVAHIPEDRHKRGLVLEFNLAENMILEKYGEQPYSKSGLLNFPAINEHADRLIQDYDIRTPSSQVAARTLSGGNQQKVVVARELDRDPKLLVASQPTRGLDVGAIEFIHKQIVAERDRGRAVLLVSLELEEVMSLSDRIAVIYEGQIVAMLNPAEVTEQELGLYMAGAKRGTEERGGASQ